MKAALMNQNTLPFVSPPGPLASAPVASENDGLYWYDDVTSTLWVSVDGTWGLPDYPDLGNAVTLIEDNGNILIDDNYVVLVRY